jgi:hypothetical protein
VLKWLNLGGSALDPVPGLESRRHQEFTAEADMVAEVKFHSKRHWAHLLAFKKIHPAAITKMAVSVQAQINPVWRLEFKTAF